MVQNDDLDYPDKLHDLQNVYLLAPRKVKAKKEYQSVRIVKK